jgi:beta-ureidopropionase / N-carbamoyl-L-amino-acid hydrolase
VEAEPVSIDAGELADRLSGLDGIGVGRGGEVNRLAWTAEDEATGRWFAEQAGELGRRVERDPAGNLWALPDGDGPWWAAGSHLDSVRGGGAFDGPLGVAAAFAVAARAAQPLAVVSFADEEGARFNTPTFGSRALVGRLDVDEALARRDDDGVALRDAMAAAGVEPDGLARAPEWLERVSGFLELHIDQTRDLAHAGAPLGVVRSLAARQRLQVDIEGQADHAGTTPQSERRDAMSAAARLIVAAEDLASGTPGFVVTAARILVEPNALTTVPARVRLWIDARAPDAAAVAAWRRRLDDAAEKNAAVDIQFTTASRSAGVEFDGEVRRALHEAAGRDAPELVCFAGHDAGVLAERRPAGMVFVRNPTGVSHSPHEHVDLEDAAAAATAMLHAAERLASG